MSDYNNPNNPNNFDKYGNAIPGVAPRTAYEPVDSAGRAPYVLLGLLVLVGIVGGALYFNGSAHGPRGDANVASAPPAASDTVHTPNSPALPQTGPVNTTPAPTTTPAPAGPPADTMKQ